jgi:antitoxin (DNA-binding transcriptional repressor) of toxin-antitoxin stability system
MKTEHEVRTLGAGKFKATCLQLMDEVAEKSLTIVITKRGKAVAQLSAPIAQQPIKLEASASPAPEHTAKEEKHGKKKDKGKKKKHK